MELSADNLQKKGAEPVATTNLIAEHSLLKDGEFDACLGCDARNDTSMHVKVRSFIIFTASHLVCLSNHTGSSLFLCLLIS